MTDDQALTLRYKDEAKIAHRVTARLQTRGGMLVTIVVGFTAPEWSQLRLFAAAAEALCRTTLLTTPTRLTFGISFDEENGLQFRPTSVPPQDDTDALYLRMRPFVLEGDATHFDRIRKILGRRLRHKAFDLYPSRQQDIFDGARLSHFTLATGGMVINSTSSLKVWLNGFVDPL